MITTVPNYGDRLELIRSVLIVDNNHSILEHWTTPCGPYTEAVYVLDDAIRHVILDGGGQALASRNWARPVPKPRIIPVGDHHVVITDAEWTQQRTRPARWYIKLTLTVVDGPYAGMTTRDHIIFNSRGSVCRMTQYMRERCDSLGVTRVVLDVLEGSPTGSDVWTEAFIGVERHARVEHLPFEDKEYARVTGYFPVTS